jgi:beta-lactamase regulating signal transducer with metallopeptidase domain
MTNVLVLVASNAVIAAILAVVTLVMTRFWRSPQLAHGLWLLVLLKLITPPLIDVSPPSAWLAQSLAPVETSSIAPGGVRGEVVDGGLASSLESDFDLAASMAVSDAAIAESRASAGVGGTATMGLRDNVAVVVPSAAERTFDFASAHWSTMLVVVWVAGAIVYFSLLVWRCFGFRRVLATSVAADEEIKASAERLASRIGLRRCPAVRMVDLPIPPLVWGVGLRPLVVLPATLLANLAPAQRDALVAHELAHVRRRDDLVRWLEVFALVLFWWNPVAWYARRRLREAEEECCDAWVVWALPDERRSYGTAMLATIEFLTDRPKLPVLAESAFGKSFCTRRIEMIMKRNMNRQISWTALGVVFLVALTVLPIVAQTTDTQDSTKAVQTPDAAAQTDSTATIDTSAATTTVTTEDRPEASVDAVESTVGTSSDVPAQASKAPDDARGQPPSTEAILKRISRLEQLLQGLADQHGGTTPARPIGDDKPGEPPDAVRQNPWRRASGGSPSGIASPLPAFEVSSDKQEQELQEQLLKLDVAAAQADVDHAKSELDQSLHANRNTPRSVSQGEIRKLQAAVNAKQVQLKRAETILELFRRQAQRKRDEAASWRQSTSQQSGRETARYADAEALLKTAHGDELARVKALNQRAAEEIRRLEKMMQDSPVSPETWSALEDFLKTYRHQSQEPPRIPFGGRR